MNHNDGKFKLSEHGDIPARKELLIGDRLIAAAEKSATTIKDGQIRTRWSVILGNLADADAVAIYMEDGDSVGKLFRWIGGRLTREESE